MNKYYNPIEATGGGEQENRFCPLEASLPKYPGRYLCKVKIGDNTVIAEAEYERLSDDNMDFDLTDFPGGSEVVAFKHLK